MIRYPEEPIKTKENAWKGQCGCISTPEAPLRSVLYRKPLRVTYGQLESLKSSVGQQQSSGLRNVVGGIALLHGDSFRRVFFFLFLDNAEEARN